LRSKGKNAPISLKKSASVRFGGKRAGLEMR
jgi:hypothetical protein